ncbi:MAG: tetratricopeptide repeat protein [Elusimicrobiota bacterium]
MRGFVIFVLITIAVFYWANNFVITGKFQRFIDNNSDKSWALSIEYNLGAIYQLALKYDKAEFYYNKILEKPTLSKFTVDTMYNLSIVYEETKRFDLAKETCNKIIEEYPDYKGIGKIKKRLNYMMCY